jgi:hypothetical protein
MTGGSVSVVDLVDGVSFRAGGYTASGVQSGPPRGDAVGGASAAPKPASAPSATGTGAPTVVTDFSHGLSATYVLDWRDPNTQQILVQVPMRTALAQIAGSTPPIIPIGQTIDTAA